MTFKLTAYPFGTHNLTLPGKQGSLEAALSIPKEITYPYLALLGHPHSLQGGTMNNKVVTTLSSSFNQLGIPALRFNFRGVGQSSGVYDEGLGESEDMIYLAQQFMTANPGLELYLAGFSFGSYVAFRAAQPLPHRALILIAPPIHHYPYTLWRPDPNKILLIQADQDTIARPEWISTFSMTHGFPVLRYPEADHFFHRQLTPLKTGILEYLSRSLS